MKISTAFPPNYSQYKRYFPNLEEHHPLFCYGDTIFNPFERTITPDLEVHEEVHMKQQGNFIEIWHDKYFNDSEFRLSQEIEAYGTQYLFIKQHMNGKLLEWGLEKMAEALSSELYGSLLTYGEAESKIRNYGKHSSVV